MLALFIGDYRFFALLELGEILDYNVVDFPAAACSGSCVLIRPIREGISHPILNPPTCGTIGL